MNCEPSHCSQSNVNGVLVLGGEKFSVKNKSLLSAGLKLIVDSVAPSAVVAFDASAVSPMSE